MKQFPVYTRYGAKHIAKLIDEDTIHFYCDKNTSYCSEMNNELGILTSFDPEGGPFIALWETPQQAIHPDLPNREIKEIKKSKGYYIISLKESNKKELIKRKPKVKQQNLLKPGSRVI